jgi:fluoride ion exporter CrcB/FEX
LRKIQTVPALAAVAAQMLGGLAAWRLAEYSTGQALVNIAGKDFDWKVLVAEMLGTLVFAFAVASAVYQKFEGAKFAATVGAGLFAGVIVASLVSNATVNPALALANQSWSRAYIFGPIVGSVVGMNLYALLFAPAGSMPSFSSVKAAPSSRRSASTSKKQAAKKKPAARKRK